MPVLHLGVVDLSYSDPDVKGANTTGEVAEILEDKYHVMRIFFEEHEKKIGEALAKAMSDQLAQRMAGIDQPLNLGDATFRIESMFRDFLDSNEIQNILPKRIQAADEGRTSRKKLGKEAKKMVGKRPKRKEGTPRQAFIDSGLYQAAFRSWMTR